MPSSSRAQYTVSSENNADEHVPKPGGSSNQLILPLNMCDYA